MVPKLKASIKKRKMDKKNKQTVTTPHVKLTFGDIPFPLSNETAPFKIAQTENNRLIGKIQKFINL